MEPPIDPPGVMLCTWCDGDRLVAVTCITDANGTAHWDTTDGTWGMECPHCDVSGAEPTPDPMDDPRIP